jgi:hypothetical protein
MSKLNFLVFLNAYEDFNPSNDPSRSAFKWNREIDGLCVTNPLSQGFSLAPGETKTLFNGTRTLAQDGTTQYSTTQVPLSTNTYQLNWVGGTAPAFRTARTTGADATTQVTVVQNGPVFTFTSTGGTPFALLSGGAVVGDQVLIGNQFNTLNQGTFTLIAVTATSFTLVNQVGVAEGPITLGSGFASQVQIFSAAGVQIGDTLVISGGFSTVTQGSYPITAVTATYVQFYSTAILPLEGPIMTEAIAVYSAAKSFIYLEADQNCTVTLNGSNAAQVKPFIINNYTKPGVFMNSSTIYSMSVTNNSVNPANLYLASAE